MSGGSGRTKDSIFLTHRSIEAMRPAELPYRVPDKRCVGLAIRVAPSGLKTWDLAYRIKGTGKVCRLSLGRLSDVSLEKARERANEITSAARKGHDLIAEEAQTRSQESSRIRVEDLINLYVHRRVKGRLRTEREIESRLKRALTSLLHRPVEELRRRDIRTLLDSVADNGNEREAEKRRQTVGAMFRWALSQDVIEIDPTGGLRAYDPGKPRDRVLSADEIRALLKWLNEGHMPSEATAILELQIATGARCGEISGICAEEINTETWIWTLPAERSKNKQSRVTPLLGRARRILEAQLNLSSMGPLFTAATGTTLTAAHVGHYLLSRNHSLPIAKFTTHDLRRTVVTMLVEMGVSLELVASVIGHESATKTTRTLVRHYVRTDLVERKRTVLEAWDTRLEQIISDIDADRKITPIGVATELDVSSVAKRQNRLRMVG